MNLSKPWLIFVLMFLYTCNDPGLKANSISHDDSQQLHVVLLVDGSLSMLYTDPEEYRKLASQAIFSLLSDKDMIAIVQFADRAKLLLPWVEAGDRKALFEGINKISSTGTTDFLLGFMETINMFKEVPEQAKKIILLFSDGELSPYPYSNEYAPLHLEYRRLIAGKSRPEIHQIYDEFRHRLVPIARSKIDSEVIPVLKEQRIEIFSIAFSEEADQEFMRYLARQTTLSEVEKRYYYVEQPTDLVEAFLGLLPFWQNKVVLYSFEGEIENVIENTVYIDEYLRDVHFIVFCDQKSEMLITGPKGELLRPIEGTHPNLSIIPITKDEGKPGKWVYKVEGYGGSCKILILGESTIRIEVDGVKHRYSYGEALNANVYLRYGDQDARKYLSDDPPPQIISAIGQNEDILSQTNLPVDRDGFVLHYSFPYTGDYTINMVMEAMDLNGNPILPRPGKELQVTVMPRFYVDPNHIGFGRIKRGQNGIAHVDIYNGLETPKTIIVSSQITAHSRPLKHDNIPKVNDTIIIQKNEILDYSVFLPVPEGRNWGNYEGIIFFETETGEISEVTFSLHVPSWVEKIGYFITAFVIIVILIIIYLVILWGRLKTPIGVLRPIKYPTGIILDNIRLSQVKKGFLAKNINFRKNEVTLGKRKSDINFSFLPDDIKVIFLFYRFGSDYIKNQSDSHEIILKIKKTGLDIKLRKGDSYTLSHGMKISIDATILVYEVF
jgi:hypothetical protein